MKGTSRRLPGKSLFRLFCFRIDADGVRSGWFDPDDLAGEGALWQVADTGSYRFTAPTDSGSDRCAPDHSRHARMEVMLP